MPSKSKTRKPVVPYGMSNKQMKRKKPINTELMRKITPLTPNQEELFRCYENNQNLVAYGCAGTGKTFITLYNALRDVLDPKTPYEKIYMTGSCRSWIHYINLRSAHGTQKEHMDIANGCKKIFVENFPAVSEALEWD